MSSHADASSNNLMQSDAILTKTFYRRSLPSTCVSFSSPSGKAHFKSAMQHSGLKCFYHLMEQYSTQAEPAYCGLSTLTIALNALSVDPRKPWKGPWRWYEETMLNCCYDLELVKKTGITLTMFTSLAHCQGVETEPRYAQDATLQEFRETIQSVCVEDEGISNIDPFDKVLVVSYLRKTLGQTGSGHFSPIAAYDPVSDSVLVLDTARFKYGAHWVPVELLFEAMLPVDPDTDKSRGYVVIHNQKQISEPHLPIPLLLRSEMKQKDARKSFKQYIRSLNSGVSFNDVARFCEDEATFGSVWTITKPQILPLGEDIAIVKEVRDLIDRLQPNVSTPTETGCFDQAGPCRPDHCRTIQLSQNEAMCIMWLACQEPKQRSEFIWRVESSTDRAKQQLLSETELLWYAIEASDQV